jgi:hypothetical protein
MVSLSGLGGGSLFSDPPQFLTAMSAFAFQAYLPAILPIPVASETAIAIDYAPSSHTG